MLSFISRDGGIKTSNNFSFSCSVRGVGNPFAVVQTEIYFQYYVQLRLFSKLVEAISTADWFNILWILVCWTSFCLTWYLRTFLSNHWVTNQEINEKLLVNMILLLRTCTWWQELNDDLQVGMGWPSGISSGGNGRESEWPFSFSDYFLYQLLLPSFSVGSGEICAHHGILQQNP